MRVVRNTVFLYLGFFTTLLLNFIQLKILSTSLEPERLGAFFTVTAVGEIISLALLVGLPLVYARYLPKFEAEGDRRKISALALFGYGAYLLLSLAIYLPILLVGKTTIATIYHNPLVSHYLVLGVGIQLLAGIMVLTVAGFNGLRKMGYSAVLSILLVLLQTVGVFLFRRHLTVGMTLRIYLGALVPAIIAGLIMFGNGLAAFPRLSRMLIRDLLPYWRYALVLGLIAPLFSFLDRLLVGYFLGMASVSLFVVAIKITSLARSILGTPLEAVVPEISYFYEKGEPAVLGRDLTIVIKLMFFLACALTTVLAVCSRWLILLISTREYLTVLVPFLIIVASLPLIAAYTPVVAAMRAIGKIALYLISDLIFLVSYLVLILILIKPLALTGVALAQFLAFSIVLTFNFAYTVPRHTSIHLSPWFFVRLLLQSLGLGVVTFFILRFIPIPVLLKLVGGVVLVGTGFLWYFIKGGALTPVEKHRLVEVFGGRFAIANWLLTLQ